MLIRPLSNKDLDKVKKFTDMEIGQGYYSEDEIKDIYLRSEQKGKMSSFLLEDDQGNLQGIRISYPPQNWNTGKGRGLDPAKWPHSIDQTAYFQSLFISRKCQGQGWGGKLSRASIESLKKMGTKGILCHSWKESPNNSSAKYLQKLGFKFVSEHPNYWSDVDYNCTRCLKPPCLCTAQEMYLDLEAQ